jgi:hypothetical protein
MGISPLKAIRQIICSRINFSISRLFILGSLKTVKLHTTNTVSLKQFKTWVTELKENQKVLQRFV